MNIVVLCGGVSSEREVSLRSSTRVSEALKNRGHHVVMIDVFFGSENMPSFADEQNYAQTAEMLRSKDSLITDELIRKTGLMGPHVLDICRQADIVFIGLHGENGEDGKVQGVFDEEHIKYTGSASAPSAIAMSKERTKQIIAPHIRMPRGTVLRKGEVYDGSIGVPCVVKPSNGGSSLGVIRVMKQEDLEPAFAECFGYDDTLIIEEYIEGRELTQGFLDGTALPPVEICPDNGQWYDYTNKYNGETKEVCPAPLTEAVLREMSEKTLRFGEILGLSVYYRIDFLLDRNQVLYALEANTLPGMTDTSLVPQEAAAIGISYPELCEKIIEVSLKKYE